MPREIPKAYEPQEIEERWAKAWFDEKLFRAENSGATAPHVFRSLCHRRTSPVRFTSGHARHTQIDMLVRWHRMRGDRTCGCRAWITPGSRRNSWWSASWRRRASTRQDLGREDFERRVWKWKAESGGMIKQQMIRLGASCDWTREIHAGAGAYRSVLEAFLRLYREGLIYRGRYMVNRCPRCQTAISDLEVVHDERAGKFVVHSLSACRRAASISGGGDHAAGNHAGRHGGRGASGGRALRALGGQEVLLPLMNREIPDCGQLMSSANLVRGW